MPQCPSSAGRPLRSLWPGDSAPVLQPSSAKLKMYTREEIGVIGSITVTAQGIGEEARLPLLVVEGTGPSLLGRDWLSRLCLDWKKILAVRTHQSLDSILEAHEAVFKPELGPLRGMKTKLHVKAEAQPLFFKARTVPFALRQKVEQELERQEQEGVVEPVKFSDWAAPIVPVMKGDSRVRICGDYKLTVNKVAKVGGLSIAKN